ncbi:MAG: alpha/beta fold hydrolase [Chloroflexi bacterium OHK40]
MPLARVNGTELYYELHGTGAPILLIPGLGLDHSYFRYAIPLLAAEARVIAVDLRGIGRSARPAGPYSVELWAADLDALLEQLGIPQAHVVGSSLGGCIAMQLAYTNPGRVRSLSLFASFSEVNKAMTINFTMRINIVRQLGMGDLIRDHVSLWTLDRNFIETPRGEEALAGVLASLSNNSPELYAEFCTALLRFGRRLPEQQGEPLFTTLLPSIPAPALVAVGDGDFLTPLELSQKMAAGLPNAELVVLPRCGHITFIEQPEASTRLVLDLVERVEQLAAPYGA